MKQAIKYIDLENLRRQVPGRPSKLSVWRWCRHGIRGRSGKRVRLEHRRVGGKIFSSLHWLDVFFQRLMKDDLAALDRRKKVCGSGDVSA